MKKKFLRPYSKRTAFTRLLGWRQQGKVKMLSEKKAKFTHYY